MRLTSSLLNKPIIDRRWGVSLMVGALVGVLWSLVLQLLKRNGAFESTALAYLAQQPVPVFGCIVLLSSLCFHLLRATTASAGNVSTPGTSSEEDRGALGFSNTDSDASELHLNAQFLIGLFDENIFSNENFFTGNLPQALLNSRCLNTSALAEEQAQALLARLRLQPATVHRHCLADLDPQSSMVRIVEALDAIRTNPFAADVHLFQGVIEISNGSQTDEQMPWALILNAQSHFDATDEHRVSRNWQSLKNEITLHELQMHNAVEATQYALPLLLAKWLS
jgi:hypothetical protein